MRGKSSLNTFLYINLSKLCMNPSSAAARTHEMCKYYFRPKSQEFHWISSTSICMTFVQYCNNSTIPRWVPICPTTASSYLFCTWEQISLKLSWAMTIHRSQGLNLQKAWIDTRKTGRTSGFSDLAISGKKNIFFHHAAGSAHRQYEANPLI